MLEACCAARNIRGEVHVGTFELPAASCRHFRVYILAYGRTQPHVIMISDNIRMRVPFQGF